MTRSSSSKRRPRRSDDSGRSTAGNRQARRGVITPAAVIEEAKNPGSVLHGAFTWDDHAAAEKYRIIEAQRLIRRCEITVKQGDESVRTYAFIGISTDREGGESANNPYRLASDVAESEDLLAVAEQDALIQLRGLKSRFEHLKRLDDIWKAIDSHS